MKLPTTTCFYHKHAIDFLFGSTPGELFQSAANRGNNLLACFIYLFF
jgi:hypothetical protein